MPLPEQTWSLTSTFVPFKRKQPRGLRLGRLRRHLADLRPDAGHRRASTSRQQGPGQVANAMRSDTAVADALAQFNQSRQPGHLRQPAHRPGRRRLIYVEPSTPSSRRRQRLPSRSCATSWSPTEAASASAPPSSRHSTEGEGERRGLRSSRTTGVPADDAHRRADRDPTDTPTGTPDGGRQRRGAARPGPAGVRPRRPGTGRRRPGRVPGPLRQGPRARRRRRSRSTKARSSAGSPSPAGSSPSPVTLIWVGTRPCRNLDFTDAGWSSSVARWAHNPEVAGSNPAPATK